MAIFTVNGKEVCGDNNRKLMHFLREDLGLCGTKNGCEQGACGTCTVLVNNVATKACLLTLEKLEGKNVETIEGLSAREKDIYSYAFAHSGAVQCGFCTPGMVMAAKGLLYKQPNPDETEIKKALRGNICRCTGYAKIIKAVTLAAKLLRENTDIPQQNYKGALGENYPRVDAANKTLGTGIYADDIVLDGMLHASAVRSAHPRARIVKINAIKALKHPNCVAVLTAKDVPGNNKIGHLTFISDWDVMIPEGEITRYVGDAVALVVSRTKQDLDEIKKLVEVEYEVLSPLTCPEDALAVGAPLIHSKPNNILAHEHLSRGNADEALNNAAYVVKEHFSVPFTEHAFLEPECAIATPSNEGLLLYTAGQSIYDEQREISRMLGIEPELVHVKGQLVGGGFGGKEDMSVQHHAALAAWCLKKPVKVLLARQESIKVHPKRHAMEMDFTVGCDKNGKLLGMKAEIISDTGAYASLGGPVLQRACTHAAGPYNFENIDIDGIAVYTNNPPAGAFRGFGVCQTAFAMEQCLNLLAKKVGISPWAIRYKNAVRPGDILPNGQIVDENCALVQCLEYVKDVYEENAGCAGISSFFKNSGVGVGLPDTGRCIISVEGGKVHLRTSAACIGQGLATVTTQIACQCLGLPPQVIVVEAPDTHRTPNSGTTTASRQTFFTGEAVRIAAAKLKEELSAGETLKTLEGREFYGEYLGVTDAMGSDKPNPISHVAYSYAAEVVILDETGKPQKVVAAFDIGKVINPIAAEGQVEGGIVMGIGYALTEDYPLKNSVPTAKYGTLGLLRATDIPKMEIHFVQSKNLSNIAYGAKGVGELATIPTAPAVAGALFAQNGVLHTKLPIKEKQ